MTRQEKKNELERVLRRALVYLDENYDEEGEASDMMASEQVERAAPLVEHALWLTDGLFDDPQPQPNAQEEPQ